jgi:hypothetical protein
MSLYIEPKNQKLLWEMIHKNPSLSLIFPPKNPISQKNKEEWFKSIISKMYSTLPQNITPTMLLNINKETLTIMNRDLQNKVGVEQKVLEKEKTVEPIYSRNAISGNRVETLNREFSERQKEYERMTQKPSVPEVSFEEKREDGVIKNMDELIQKQLREREEDLNKITKTFQQNQETIRNPPINKPFNSPILSIKEEIKMDFSEMIQNEEPAKKRVSWNIDVEEKRTNQTLPVKIEMKMEELSQKIELLMEFLEKKIPDFQKEYESFSTKKIVREILEEELEKIL